MPVSKESHALTDKVVQGNGDHNSIHDVLNYRPRHLLVKEHDVV